MQLLSQDYVAQMESLSETLIEKRKANKPPANYPTKEQISTYKLNKEQSEVALPGFSNPNI